MGETASTTTAAPRPKYDIAVLSNALDVLEELARSPEPLGVSEIARRTGMTKSAAFRVLATLGSRGYVNKQPESSKYSIGSRVFMLADSARRYFDLVRLVRPYLHRLNTKFGETVNLGVLEGSQVHYVEIVESPKDLRMAARPGSRDSLHSTALGKAMLAYLDDFAMQSLLDENLVRKTSKTITDPAILRHELSETRMRGYSLESGENEESACCIGAPLFGPFGKVEGAISVAGPADRIRRTGIEEIARSLRLVAAEATKKLGGEWPAWTD